MAGEQTDENSLLILYVMWVGEAEFYQKSLLSYPLTVQLWFFLSPVVCVLSSKITLDYNRLSLVPTVSLCPFIFPDFISHHDLALVVANCHRPAGVVQRHLSVAHVTLSVIVKMSCEFSCKRTTIMQLTSQRCFSLPVTTMYYYI